MKTNGWLIALLLPLTASGEVSDAQLRTAAGKSVALVQRSAAKFLEVQTCFSCHHHGLPLQVYAAARSHGVPVDEAGARKLAVRAFTDISSLQLPSVDAAALGWNFIDPALADGVGLITAHAAGVAPSLTTGIYAMHLANWQRSDGRWFTADARPPQSHSDFAATLYAMRAVQLYMPPELARQKEETVRKAREWLERAKPITMSDRACRLMGLYWAGAATEEAARSVREKQRADGGWAQLESRQSDAYASGEALMALLATGNPKDEVVERGLKYLLETQQMDGSWKVETRLVSPARVSPPFFETGFPHGKHQFVSSMATEYATMALLLAMPKIPNSPPVRSPEEVAVKDEKPWMRAAAFGSADELKALLDKGLDVNSRSGEGTTVLMMAAHDPLKVRLLLSRGADVNATAKKGHTALLAATLYCRNADSVRQMLDKGANVNPQKVMYSFSPLNLAAAAGDLETVKLLVDHGAKLDHTSLLLGTIPMTPGLTAVGYRHPEVVRFLAGRKRELVDVSPQDTPLVTAVVMNDAEMVRALASAGAKVNAVDSRGYTALLYAASLDFGDTEVIRALLAAGADKGTRSKDGKTALDIARGFRYPGAMRELGAK